MICLKILIFSLVIKQIVSYTYIPPDRRIEVVEHSEYLFGIEEDFGDDIIVKCYYVTDTGINGSFDVGFGLSLWENKTALSSLSQNQSARIDYNVIKPKGDEGLCQISVLNVNDTGPSTWTLTATIVNNNNQEQNLTGIGFNVHFFYLAPVLNSPVEVQKYAGFYNYMTLPSSITLTSCTLKFRNAEIDLDVHSPRANIFLSPYYLRDEEVANQITSLGRGLCGVKVLNVTSTEIYPEEWRLSATDDQGRSYRRTFDTRVNEYSYAINQTISVVMGAPYDLQCGKGAVQQFCILYNAAGALVHTSDCKYRIASVAMDDLGVWKCYSGRDGAMETTVFRIELIGIGPEYVESWQNETDDHLTIGCRIINHSRELISYCLLTAPNEVAYHITPGVATDRYIALGTDFRTATCVLEIKKPLEEHEKGQWTCEVFRHYSGAVGTFIRVGPVSPPDYPKYLKVMTQLKKPFTIGCEVPYSSQYCHIRAPNGTIFMDINEQQVTLGRCSKTVGVATASDNGTWVCSFARETGTADDQIFVEVTIAEVLSYYRSIEVDSGDAAELICRSGGYPLIYCRFISPTGVSYHIENHRNSSRISYYGKGLEYGDCGITLNDAKSSDNGYWTCATKLFRDKEDSQEREDPEEVTAQILLNVTPYLMDGTNIAGIGTGIAVGVVVITSIVAVIAFNTWKRRRHNNIAGSNNNPQHTADGDNDSNNSHTLFSAGPPPRSYTNPQTVPLEPDHEHQL